jgi:hypothetical protein
MKKYISVSPQMFMLNNLERFFTSNYKGNVLSAVATAVSKLGHEQASVCKIQRILKRFEQYIKERASNDFEGKKNATCVADGNELLQFYSTTFTCALDVGRIAALC